VKVPLLDLRRGGADLDRELTEAFTRVLHSGHYILGPEVEALERDCAAYCQSRHALGVSSGTDALILALMTLGIGAGDEVICPTYTFFASAGSIWRLGARPVFVDSLAGTFNADPADVAAKLGPKTKAIMAVHLFGRCEDLTPLRSLGLPIVEDAAQALGAEAAGRRAGSFGAINAFSFFPSKNLGALGDAGLVVCDDDALAERGRILRTHGGKPKYHHQLVGGNFRIDALQAALLRVKLSRLDAWTAARQANAARYEAAFATQAARERLLLPSSGSGRHIWNQYVVRVPGAGRRDALRNFLGQRGVGTEIYYPVPMHLQACFSSLGHREGDFPVAEQLARDSLALPIFPELSPDELAYVVGCVEAFLES
jgi:dTDP-4-amino-4,6-dideoxygalactose transaminase